MVHYHSMFEFTVLQRDGVARRGEFATPHGTLQTPDLAIVGTEGVFKTIDPQQVPDTKINYAISNTFHIYVKDILPKIEAAGGLHAYMNYPNVLATDSGGFQVFSLGFGITHGTNKLGAIFPGSEGTESDTDNPVIISEEGASFPFNGKRFTLSPESSMDLQHRIGADIMFAFDECTSSLNTKEYTANSLERTHRWLERCITHHAPFKEKQALFAIVQGGAYKDLREYSARFMADADVPGYGIGGSLGKTKEDMHHILEWTLPLLPDERPRHLLGIGHVRDIFESVERGVDLFDCVIPTREARHRVLYTVTGRVHVRISRVTDDIIDTRPGSPTLRDGVTFRQLALWFQSHDIRALKYATLHNIFFYTELMKEIRTSIEEKRFKQLKEQYYRYY